jgi:hypothetical protein
VTSKPLKLAKDLAFPLEIAGQAIAMFGIRGSGKTNTAGALAEELLDQNHPIAIIDPTDAWWGLRAGRDGGQGGGYPVFIFGGSHADVPLSETDGKVIAEFLVREQVPVVLSLRHLRKAAQRRFVTEFCEELYHLKGRDENRTPLTVFIDEAPLFVPQKVMGEVARTVGAVEDLIARGRNAGFGVVLISQRSATLNADVRTQADTIICHRVTAPLDRKAISDWFEENATTSDLKAILHSLATLKNGEAWVWSPSIDIMSRVQMRMRRTFDSSATPKAGTTVRPPKKLADVDLGKLKDQLAATIEKAKADDPKELRKRIAELEREVKAKPAASAPVKPERVEVTRYVFDEGAVDRVQRVVEDAVEQIQRVVKLAKTAIGDAFGEYRSQQRSALLKSKAEAPKALPNGKADFARNAAKALSSAMTNPLIARPASPSNGKLNAGERRILTVLAQVGSDCVKRRAAILAGFSPSGGYFNNLLGALRTKQMIEGSERLTITDIGRQELGPIVPLPTGDALVAYWKGKVNECQGQIIDALVAAKPRPLSKEELAADIAQRGGKTYAPDGGYFNNMLGELRTMQLISGYKEIGVAEALWS